MSTRIRYENTISGGSTLMGSTLVCETCCVMVPVTLSCAGKNIKMKSDFSQPLSAQDVCMKSHMGVSAVCPLCAQKSGLCRLIFEEMVLMCLL